MTPRFQTRLTPLHSLYPTLLLCSYNYMHWLDSQVSNQIVFRLWEFPAARRKHGQRARNNRVPRGYNNVNESNNDAIYIVGRTRRQKKGGNVICFIKSWMVVSTLVIIYLCLWFLFTA